MVQEVGHIPATHQAGPGFQNAGIGARIGAYVIDGLLFQGVFIGLYFASFAAMVGAAQSGNYSAASSLMNVIGFVLPALGILLAVIYVALLGRGQTLGMKITGVRLVSLETLGAPGFWRAVGRNVVFSGGSLVVVGPFSPLFDDSGQQRGWHDRATNTWMIDDRSRQTETAAEAAPPNHGQISAPALAPGHSPASAPAPFTPMPSPVPPPPPGYAPGLVTGGPLPPAPHAVAPVWQQPPAAAVFADDDDLDATRVGVVARAPRSWILRLEDGQDVHLSARGFIGRNPADPDGQQTAFGGSAAAQLIPVRDATKTVSKTHLAFGIDGSRLWVQERGSTNGTKIIRTTGEHLDVSGAVRSYVGNGDVLILGDHRITVVTG